MDVLEKARPIALEAGALLLEGLGQAHHHDRKSSSVDLVTEYDRRAEELIAKRLAQSFPEHGLVGEEGSSRQGSDGFRWYVDPLDGTNNFAHGLPHFAVSMALYQHDLPQVALTYDPVKQELFEAVAGEGFFLNRRPGRVSQREELVESMLATGFPYDRHTDPHNNVAQLEAFLTRCRGIRRFGSASLDLAYVAAGRYDGFWEYKLGPWDVAAGILLVREAGGKVTATDGKPISLTSKVALVASNGKIHDAMVEVLSLAQR
ncbi:MAG: inositol monophosphatase family protein [Vulcanimicrobiota bacterium]